MAEYKISRLRYTWKGAWTTSQEYQKDDVVSFGGSTWVCFRKHTASAFQNDQEYLANPGDSGYTPAWIKMTDGRKFRHAWVPSGELYSPGDTVLYKGVIYLAIESHTSDATFLDNADKWAEYVSALAWANDWSPLTRYGIGDIVQYNGIVYKCIAEHTSLSTTLGLELGNQDGNNDSTAELWEVYYEGIQYRGDWTDGIRYTQNDLVKYGGSILRCTEGHSAETSIDNDKFQNEFLGFNFYDNWSSSVYYAVGDVVRHGGYVYVAKINNNDINPATSIYGQPSPDTSWSLISKAVRLRGNWSTNTDYLTGDLVRRGGYLYVALLDTTISSDDGSTLDYLDSSNWEIVVAGDNWTSSWSAVNNYEIGDLVLFLGNVYRCNIAHPADNTNYPGDNGNGFYYWDLVLQAGDNVGLSAPGDLLTYDLSRELAGDGSTFGATNVPIGTANQVVHVTDEIRVGYKQFGVIQKVVYVSSDDRIALDDETDSDRGTSADSPYRTLRFACEQVAKSTDYELTTIKVATGIYHEILPIIVPAGVAIQGSELRSTTVKPLPAVASLANDSAYQKTALGRLKSILGSILQLTSFTKSPGNDQSQIISVSGLENVSFSPPVFDFNLNEQYDDVVPTDIITEVQDTVDTATDYITFYLDSSGAEPTLSGTNTRETSSNAYGNIEKIITANREFIIAEMIAFVKQTYPSYVVDEFYYDKFGRHFVDAVINDTLYPGTYHMIEAARYYKNAVLGSSSDDMFYVRNSTGIRDLTTKGLTGTLNPPNVFELYQRPTGGSFVSLDPGWGPNDDRTWITTRSPYIQNVTTFGDNCIGQKIDGALHAGGNKSIVSNDFTQVCSDGIGAWVLNNGRAELVSVFTYYAQIGMFAEDGGVIRATNGNSSYGSFGAVADGNDPTETPAFAEVDTRTTQATIASAFAGEVNDEILILEYENAGENYSFANYTFVGSGVNAQVVQDEFRDNAVFEALLKNAPGDSGGTIGGLAYSLKGNNAQLGTTTTLTLASNDDSEESELLGLRVIITSGKGAGQYGYVTGFNPISKVLNVAKETDDTAGWDHVIPGTPIQTQLFTDNTYRFEPRVTFSHPGFTASDVNLGDSGKWVDIAYGETKETYLAVTGGAGTGVTLGIIPITAEFTVDKVGRKYEVTVTNPGAGYEVGQTVTISGDDVGGVDGEHDVVITITATSDDSTNSILGFTHIGTAQSGRFVAIETDGDTFSYSEDGDSWTTGTLPVSADWSSIAAGDNKFVAIRKGSTGAAYSEDGKTWSTRSLPSSSQWNAVTFGRLNNGASGLFVAIAGDGDAGAFSTDGKNWTATTLPDIGDSSFNEWVDIAYGKNKFVAIANSGNFAAVGTYSSVTGTMTWQTFVMDVIADSTIKDWQSVTYGNNRFVAVSGTGEIAYSFDGEDWLPATMPTQDGSTAHFWKKIRYGQGVFFAVGDSGTNRAIGGDIPPAVDSNFSATSEDGVHWTTRTLTQNAKWESVAFGNPDITLGDSTTQSNSTGMWVAVAYGLDHGSKVLTGAQAQGRAIVEAGSIDKVRLWNVGSGYSSPPTVSFTDPANTADAYVEVRTGDAVLAQPSWINRGVGYRTSTTQVTLLGDGFADVIPSDQFVSVSGLALLPGPGTQFRFRGDTSTFYTVITTALESTDADGTITGRFRVSPELTVDDFLEHTSQVEIRERYSQVRISGHDFLDVGSGNFTETNYPTIYTSGENYASAPENEVLELDGGRVFYTSTDQSGNFRTGELFQVEQATGIVTISADFFDLKGLTELALGGVRLGGSGTVVREFSTDPAFTADSNNIVPTQRAIKAYLQNRLNVGGSDLLTASFIAGTVKVGPNLIGNVAGIEVQIPKLADFSGAGAEISGSMMAQTMFFRSFDPE